MCINYAISINSGIKTGTSQPGAKKKKSQTLPSGKALTFRDNIAGILMFKRPAEALKFLSYLRAHSWVF